MTPEDDRLGRIVQRAFRSAELGARGRGNALERQFAIEASLGEDFEWADVVSTFEPSRRVEAETAPERLSPLGYAKTHLLSFFGRWLPGSDKLAA